jgi:hypothetical protein
MEAMRQIDTANLGLLVDGVLAKMTGSEDDRSWPRTCS